MRTADSGYLTRKLCDSAQEVVIRERDCGTGKYLHFSKQEVEALNQKFFEVIYGRVVAEDVKDAKGNTILNAHDLLNKENVTLLEAANIEIIKVRTPLVCNTISGICQHCYGMDLSTRQMIQVGVPVGVIAAQSI